MSKFSVSEQNIVQDLKTHPKDFQPVFKELHQLQNNQAQIFLSLHYTAHG